MQSALVKGQSRACTELGRHDDLGPYHSPDLAFILLEYVPPGLATHFDFVFHRHCNLSARSAVHERPVHGLDLGQGNVRLLT